MVLVKIGQWGTKITLPDMCSYHTPVIAISRRVTVSTTCKAKGINPYESLAATLKKNAGHPINRIEELLRKWKPA